MITKILYGAGMLLVTVLIQFILYKTKKNVSFWSGVEPVLILCVLGLIDNDPADLAGILGYVLGDEIGRLAGWHKRPD